MSMPKDQAQEKIVEAWRTYIEALEQSIEQLDKEIKESREMAGTCTDEWCEATQHYIDDINNALFSISEPRWTEKEDSDKIKKLKRRVHDLYADYRDVYRKVAA